MYGRDPSSEEFAMVYCRSSVKSIISGNLIIISFPISIKICFMGHGDWGRFRGSRTR